MLKAIKLVLKENTIFDVYFNDGKVKRYDILKLADKFQQLNALQDRKLFLKGRLMGWSGVVWNDELDIECDTVYEEGIDVTEEYDDVSNVLIGYAIKEKRLRINMTQEELAKLLNFSSRSSISNIENGRDLPFDKISFIAETLGTTEAYLMGWDRDPEKVEYFFKALRSITDEQFDMLISKLNECIEINSKNKQNSK